MKNSLFVCLALGSIALGGSACDDQSEAPLTTDDYQIEMTRNEEDRCPIAEVFAQIQADPTYLETLRESSDPSLRILDVNSPMTMDYRVDRLTIAIDQENKIITMQCV